MNFKPKRWQLIAAVVLLVLIFTNPSAKDCMEFSGESRHEYTKVRRECNFLLFSIYDTYGGAVQGRYLGVFKNFIKL